MHPPPPLPAWGRGLKILEKSLLREGGELGQKILFDEGEGEGGVT